MADQKRGFDLAIWSMFCAGASLILGAYESPWWFIATPLMVANAIYLGWTAKIGRPDDGEQLEERDA